MEMQAPFAARPLTPEEKRKVDRLLVIAIDPGHGGEDPGAIGPTGLKEKDVVLAIAMQLRERLNAKPGVRVLLTRDSDFFVPLGERVKKAERVQADLFVSIHADAFFTPEARGASVFALSQGGASSAAARWMANRENAADSVGGVNVKGVKDAQVMRAMLDMSTTAQIKDSMRVGSEVLSRMGKVGKLHRGQVEQASFAVLKASGDPVDPRRDGVHLEPAGRGQAARSGLPPPTGRGAVHGDRSLLREEPADRSASRSVEARSRASGGASRPRD